MKNKNLLIIVGTIVILIAGYFVLQNNQNIVNDDNKLIKIGAILPLTGDAANYGIGLKRGMDLAVKEINSDSLTPLLKIIYEDDKASPNFAISAYNKLKSVDKINYIIGGMFSNVALSLAPIVENDNIILMSPTASAVEYSEYGDHLFRIYPSDIYDGNFLANFTFHKLNVNNVAIISVDAASTIEISRVFAEKFKLNGGTISFTNSYKKGDKNFRSILQKLKSNDSDIIFIPGYLEDLAILLKQAKELGLNKTFLTISTVYDNKLFEIAGNAAEGLIFSAPVYNSSGDNLETKYFVKIFSEEYGETPDILAAYGYDVVKISYNALSKSHSNLDEIINNLMSIKDYPGVTGKTSFDKNGDVIKELRILKVKDNSFKEY